MDTLNPGSCLQGHGHCRREQDRVRGYFGMREVSLGPVGPGGHPRPLLNGEFVFQIGMLDQVRQHELQHSRAPKAAAEQDIEFVNPDDAG